MRMKKSLKTAPYRWHVIFFGFPPKTNHTSFFIEPLFCTLFGHMGQALRR